MRNSRFMVIFFPATFFGAAILALTNTPNTITVGIAVAWGCGLAVGHRKLVK